MGGRGLASGLRLGAEALLLGLAYVPIALGRADDAPLMWACVTGLLSIRLLVLRRPRDLWVLAAGIILGGGSDLLTVSRGVYAYTASDFLPWAIPAWMLLLWGHIFLFMRSLFCLAPLRTELPRRGYFRGGRVLLLDAGAVILLKAAFYAFSEAPARAAVAGAVIILARYAIARPHRADIILGLLALAGGPAVEGELIRAGLYEYRDGLLFGVPLWLAEWWLFAVPLLNRLGVFVDAWGQAQGGVGVRPAHIGEGVAREPLTGGSTMRLPGDAHYCGP